MVALTTTMASIRSRLERRHVEQGIAAHADADGPAARDAEMIEQGQGVERALAMGQRPLRIGGAAVAAGVGGDQLILARKLIAAGIGPVVMAAGAAMQQQQRRAGAVDRVMQLDAVHVDGVFRMVDRRCSPSLNSGGMAEPSFVEFANASRSSL